VKTHPGGVHSGLLSDAYQTSGRFTTPEIAPTARVKKRTQKEPNTIFSFFSANDLKKNYLPLDLRQVNTHLSPTFL